MTVNRSLVATVALTATIATSAIGAITALGAPTGASPFELTLEYEWTSAPPSRPLEGTFAARAPFCRSGTSVELPTRVGAAEAKHRLTCDDGSGSLVLSTSVSLDAHYVGLQAIEGSFRIVEGTGSYVGLRGKGSQRSELSEGLLDSAECVDPFDFSDPSVFCPWIMTWRSTFEGVAGEDAVAPTIGFSSVEVTKLPRPDDAYSLKLTIALRDDVEGNPVSYLLRVTPTKSARELARSFGTAQAGTVSMTMRMRYYKPPRRAVLLRLSASDEVGNESSLDRVLKLPR